MEEKLWTWNLFHKIKEEFVVWCSKRGEKVENYTFERMWLDLKNGYQIYYTYVGNRYVLFKTADNCYTQKLLSEHKKNPQTRMLMLTLKRVKEMFPYFEDIEYKVASDENNKI